MERNLNWLSLELQHCRKNSATLCISELHALLSKTVNMLVCVFSPKSWDISYLSSSKIVHFLAAMRNYTECWQLPDTIRHRFNHGHALMPLSPIILLCIFTRCAWASLTSYKVIKIEMHENLWILWLSI